MQQNGDGEIRFVLAFIELFLSASKENIHKKPAIIKFFDVVIHGRYRFLHNFMMREKRSDKLVQRKTASFALDGLN
jgi:hypothetical protein